MIKSNLKGSNCPLFVFTYIFNLPAFPFAVIGDLANERVYLSFILSGFLSIGYWFVFWGVFPRLNDFGFELLSLLNLIDEEYSQIGNILIIMEWTIVLPNNLNSKINRVKSYNNIYSLSYIEYH